MLRGTNEDLLIRGSHYGADAKLAVTEPTINTFQILFLPKAFANYGQIILAVSTFV